MKCYSTNNEDFNYNCPEDAIDDVIGYSNLQIGSVFSIYEGEAVRWEAGDFADAFPVDSLVDRAYDEVGEYADDWPNCTIEQEKDLVWRIKDMVNEWADENNLQPNFYRIKNVREIKVKLLDENGNYEVQE